MHMFNNHCLALLSIGLVLVGTQSAPTLTSDPSNPARVPIPSYEELELAIDKLGGDFQFNPGVVLSSVDLLGFDQSDGSDDSSIHKLFRRREKSPEDVRQWRYYKDLTARFLKVYVARLRSDREIPASVPQGEKKLMSLQTFTVTSNEACGTQQTVKMGKKLGESHFAKVYAAEVWSTGDENNKDPIVVKESKRVNSVDMIQGAIIRSRIQSDYLVPVKGFFRRKKTTYLMMPRMTSSLADDYKKLKKRGEKAVVDAFKKALLGLIDLHAAGYRHRDISDNNILFQNDKVFIGDFDTITNGPSSDEAWGTIGFMAPEAVIPHKTEGKPRDVWSMAMLLAMTLIEALWDESRQKRFWMELVGNDGSFREPKDIQRILTTFFTPIELGTVREGIIDILLKTLCGPSYRLTATTFYQKLDSLQV